ncbi:MAG: hypothetical protein JSV86_10415 [Gemmatimonadota bacterium]|nr:MAG: hypothetical protein JSV86_10415 [Gemmatimonadota bacterium]
MLGDTIEAWCECGRSKQLQAAACDRCAFLDGTGEGEAKIIAVLRQLGGVADMYQIAAGAGTTLRSVQRNIAKLKRGGRVYRVTDNDGRAERVLWGLMDVR